MRKKRKYAMITLLLCGVMLTACKEEEPETNISVDAEADVIPYTLINAEDADVIKSVSLTTLSVQSKEQEVSFDTTGQYVNKVYVRRGDAVKKGDILCELTASNLETEIEDLTYSIQRNELRLGYLDEKERLSIQDEWIMVMNGFSNSDKAKENVKSIQKDYERQRLLINDSLEFDREELAKKQEELRKSRMYATMDGTVFQVNRNLEGSTTRAGEVIMTIIDSSECYFKVTGIENKDLFKEGELYNMNVGFGTGKGDYLITPVNINDWTEEMLFSVYTGPDEAEIEVGTYGTLTVVLEEHKNVLSIPKSVLKSTEDSYYVYILNEDDVREIRFVEVGLIGDDKVEILGGITKEEKIVKK